jgi:hypothetical protein
MDQQTLGVSKIRSFKNLPGDRLNKENKGGKSPIRFAGDGHP